MIIIEDPTVTVECRTQYNVCSFSLVCSSIKFDDLSCSFTSMSCLTNSTIAL